MALVKVEVWLGAQETLGKEPLPGARHSLFLPSAALHLKMPDTNAVFLSLALQPTCPEYHQVS